MANKLEIIDEKLRRYMKIPPKKKLEILEELHRMAVKNSSPKVMKLRWKLREV
ncbi:MAG: hypothetical protein PHY46_04895 [Candidatus Omnitrophica bacterium]|nr:hypothetical protein [Candidatus Omnitrophota bacterium]MDD5356202.1 hypothetical protein [Candidatus Omnitrophota bacterium]